MRMALIIFLMATFFCPQLAGAMDMDDIVPISAEKEARVGASVAKQVEAQFQQTDDPLVQKRFEDIGNRLAEVCDRKVFVYRFKVLKGREGNKEESLNAFALPGGYVYIFDTLMEELGTDDKIAAVTAHEIGHICARHAVKRMQGSLGANVLMILAVVAAQDGRNVGYANEAINQLMLSYSREDELEADRLSVKYLKEADFDPNGVLQSLLMMKGLRKKGSERRYAYYKTHPYLSERIAHAKSEIRGYTDFDSYINMPEDKDGIY